MSIFNSVVEVAQAIARKEEATLDEIVKHQANGFRSNNKEESTIQKEPDWGHLIRNAQTPREKFEVMAARDAWQDNVRIKAFEQQQLQFDKKVLDVIASPVVRNKEFYDDLQKNHPSIYYDKRIQNQRKADRQAMGLGFHLRAK